MIPSTGRAREGRVDQGLADARVEQKSIRNLVGHRHDYDNDNYIEIDNTAKFLRRSVQNSRSKGGKMCTLSSHHP